MKPPTKLKTLYIDFDAFFANVEKQLSSTEANRPTGVSAFPSEYSAIIAQCYLAKAFGIHRGMKLKDARKLCPNLRVVAARHDVYVKMHHRIIAAIEKHVPVKKVWSVDEMECDFGELNDSTIIRVSRDIRRQIQTDIGSHVTPSMGLSSSNLLAKIAAEMNKPNGFEILHPKDLPGRLLDVTLRNVPGIAGNMEKRLNEANITNLSDFWACSPKQIRSIWRSVEGERLWWMLRGYDIEKAPTKRAMFGHSRQLSGDWKTPKRAEDCLRLLTCQAARRMRKDGFLATKLNVSFKEADDKRWGGDAVFSPLSDDYNILRHMRRLYQAGLEQLRPETVSKVHITLHGLVKNNNFSEALFLPLVQREQSKKLTRLSHIIDQTNEKYAAPVLTVGLQEQPPGDYAGGKIAFGRIPDSIAYLKRVQAEGEDRL